MDQNEYVNGLRTWFINFYIGHRYMFIIYGVWILLHITLWTFSSPKNKYISNGFYPFDRPLSDIVDATFSLIDNIDVYDFSEFFFYTIIIPVIIAGFAKIIYSYFPKINMQCIRNYVKRHKVIVTIYMIWTIVQSVIYVHSQMINHPFYPKSNFYPFINTSHGTRIFIDCIGVYDFPEFFVYVLLLPIFILFISWSFKRLCKKQIIENNNYTKKLNCSIKSKQTIITNLIFKDYYLILGIGRDATQEEIEMAFKDKYAKFKANKIDIIYYQDTREAFAILSDNNNKKLYDLELALCDNSNDYENYVIKDQQLAKTIKLLRTNMVPIHDSSSDWGIKIGKGCLLVFVFVIFFVIQTCCSAIMEQKGRNSVKNSYSYVQQ